jgi:hypothetical protein
MPEFKPNAETFRILALAHLANKNIDQARLEIRKALELEPRWESLRLAAAMIDYFGILAAPALPTRVVSWPEPVDWSLVKRDEESIGRLRQAANAFQELGENSDKSIADRRILRIWRLATLLNDPDRQEQAAEECRNILREDPANYGAIAWALARNLDVDLTPSEKALRTLVDAGIAETSQIVALVGCYLAAKNVSEARKLLENTKHLFNQNQAGDLWLFWYSQCLVISGDPVAALNAIDNSEFKDEMRTVRSLVLRALARTSGDDRDLVEHLEISYRETQDPRFLLQLCELKAHAKDWNYVANNAEELAKQVATPDAVRLGSIAAHNSNRFDLCLNILDQNRHLFGHQNLPNELRRLRVSCLQRLGTLPQAVTESEKLAQDEPTTLNLLGLAEMYSQKGDLRNLAVVARKLLDATDVMPQQLIQVARLIQWENRDLAISVWRKAVKQDLPDLVVGMATALGYQLGLDDEIRPLLNRIAELAAKGEGDVQLARIQDLVSHIKQRREQGAVLDKIYKNGLVPIHLIADRGNIPLINFYYRLLQRKHAPFYPLTQLPILARHGGRSVTVDLSQTISQWRINIDVTAVLLADGLGILEDVLEVSRPLCISSHLIPALVEMRDRLGPPQPSRLTNYEQVLNLERTGQLKVVGCDLPGNYANEGLVRELGREWVAMYENARAVGGYIVDFLPLHKLGSSDPPTSLPDDAHKYLVNCRNIVESLRSQGPLSAEDYTEALDKLGTEAKQESWLKVNQGAELFCDSLIVETLADAGLLHTVCERFRVRIQSMELERVRAELRSQERSDELTRWLSDLIEKLGDGLDKGSFEIIAPSKTAADMPKETSEGILTQCLFDLLQFRLRDGDVLWIDDRNANSYSNRDGAPIITIDEVLRALVGAGKLTRNAYYDKISALRASNVRFIPVETTEILHRLQQATIEHGTVVETQTLIDLRRYIAACLLEADIPQWPPLPQGVANENGEVGFFVHLGRTITDALIQLWKDSENDDETCIARSNWIIANLYHDQIGLNNPQFQQRSLEDYKYLVALRLADLVSQAIGLPSERDESGFSVRHKYFAWLFDRVLRKRFDADPSLNPSIVEILKKNLFNMRGDFQRKVPKLAVIKVLQELFEDLPQPIREELIKDPDFIAGLGLRYQPIISIADVLFERSSFLQAARKAVNGQESTIKPLGEVKEVKFQPARGRDDQPALSFTHPKNERKVTFEGAFLGLLSDSPITREAFIRKNAEWFDSPADTFEIIVAQLVSTENVEQRVKAFETWRDTSATVFYENLRKQLLVNDEFRQADLIPPSVEGLLRHLRVRTDILHQDFRSALVQSADSVIQEEGLQSAIERLVGLPRALPDPIFLQFAGMPDENVRQLIKSLLKAPESPTFQLHVVALLLRSKSKTHFYRRLARRVIKKLFTKEAEYFNAFSAMLKWVDAEFGHWNQLERLPTAIRIALVWFHTHKLFSIFTSEGVNLQWIDQTFSSMPQRVAHEIFERTPDYWFDIAHPRKIDRVTFSLSGLSYAIG